MPWLQVWQDAPKDESLRVWKTEELPLGTYIGSHHIASVRMFREAQCIVDPDTWRNWYECRHCGGWIEGNPNTFQVNTLDSHRLSGRWGTEYHCIRCGEQIAFIGAMS